jgi:hypothetical protein
MNYQRAVSKSGTPQVQFLTKRDKPCGGSLLKNKFRIFRCSHTSVFYKSLRQWAQETGVSLGPEFTDISIVKFCQYKTTTVHELRKPDYVTNKHSFFVTGCCKMCKMELQIHSYYS